MPGTIATAAAALVPSPAVHTITASTPATNQKLTKKQKKALAFRDKFAKLKSKTKTKQTEDELTEMAHPGGPLVEKSDRARHQSNPMEVGGLAREGAKGSERGGKEASQGQKDARNVRVETQETERRKGEKRKREQLDDGLDEAKHRVTEKSKKRKREKVEPGVGKDEKGEREGEGEAEEEVNEGERKETKEKDKQRLILFLGNLKYTTSIDAIRAHFSTCDPPPEIRLLTPKSSLTGKPTIKSKGCAFLEFKKRSALQQALKLHHSMLDGRMINVELTAGGGGKGEKRMEKLRERNKTLLGQRKKRAEKAESKDASLPSRPDKPQRYSTTSGIEQSSLKKRTWSVGDIAEDEVHRGGKKHRTASRSRSSRKTRDWATGVNAIPVS